MSWSSIRKHCFLVITLSVFLISCGVSSATDESKITVAGAANLRFALAEVTDNFTAATGISVETVFASSGKLTAQIEAGAPYDVFLSADERYPAALAAARLTLGPARAYARGPLALWSTTSGIPLDPDSLRSDRITKIAIPNPATAPYGQAAMRYLENKGLAGPLAHKFVFGESVGQANQFVYSGAAEIGFTALATVFTQEKFHRFNAIDKHTPVTQSGVILSASEQPEAAAAFLAYLLSPEGQKTLQKFGYFTAE